MGVSMISSDKIGWQRVDNVVDLKMIDGSLAHTLKPAKRIKRSTRALNSALKAYATLKSYNQYVRAKTRILRNITDNEMTDEDTDVYSAGLEFQRDDSISRTPPSPPQIEDLPAGSSNLNSIHNANPVKLSGKGKGARRKTSDVELSSVKSSRKEKEAAKKTDEIESDPVKSSGKDRGSRRKTGDIELGSVETSSKGKEANKKTVEIEPDSVKTSGKRKRTTETTDEIESDSVKSPKKEKRAARKTDEIETDSLKLTKTEKRGAGKSTDEVELDFPESSKKEKRAATKTDDIETDSLKSAKTEKRGARKSTDEVESDFPESSKKEKRAATKKDDIETDSLKSTKPEKRGARKSTNEVELDFSESSTKEKRAATKTDDIETDSLKSTKTEKRGAIKSTDEVESDFPESSKKEKRAATKTDGTATDCVKSSGKKKKTTKVNDEIEPDARKPSEKEGGAVRKTEEVESDSLKSSKKKRGETRKTDKIESDSVKSTGKTKRATRKMNNAESDFSEPTTTKNVEHNEQGSTKDKTAGSKQRKSLLSVKRNLTSVLDYFSPVGQNSKIHGGQNNHDVYNSIKSSGAGNNGSDCDSDYEKPALVTNEISVDVHAENEDEGIIKEEEVQENEEYEENEENAENGIEETEETGKVKQEKNDDEEEDDKNQLQLQEDLKMMDESPTKKSQLVITSTEILTSKIKIVRDESEGDVLDYPDLQKSGFPPETTLLMGEEATEDDEQSRESKRVGQLKRINLTTNSSDSEESELSDQEDKKIVVPVGTSRIHDSEKPREEKLGFLQKQPSPLPSTSQAISDPSDSDESADEADDQTKNGKVLTGQPKNYKLSFSTISDNKTSASARTDNKHVTPEKRLLKNTAKDQNEADLVENFDFFPEGPLIIDEEATEDNELSPESKRVGQMKRLNLITNSSESEESELSEQEDEKFVTSTGANRIDVSAESPGKKSGLQKLPLPSASQVISNPSDSDKSADEADDQTKNGKVLTGQPKNYKLSFSTISDNKTSASARTDNKHVTPEKRLLKNTAKDQNEADLVENLKVENFDFSPEGPLIIDEEATEDNELSPESKRVGQMKRLNLITNSSESEESELSEQEDEKFVTSTGANRIDVSAESPGKKSGLQKLPLPTASQVISNPSDSDESADEADDQTNDGEASIVQPSETSTSTRIKNEPRSPDKRSLENMAKGLTSKSIISQIRDQDNAVSSTALEKIEDAVGEEKKQKKRRHSETIVKESAASSDKIDDVEGDDGGKVRKTNKDINQITNDVPCESESLRYVLKNLAHRAEDGSERELENFDTSCTATAETKKHEERELDDFPAPRSRPVELCDFIDREGLIATEELSTITAKDLKKCAREDGDEEIWLMEIPTFILSDGEEFCGKDIAFEGGKITINSTTYKTTCRDEKSVSCIVRSGKKKARFKTVHLETAGCIVVRQESSSETALPASPSKTILSPLQTDTPVQRSVVPFPKNLKLRNPLLGLDPLNTTQDTSTPKNIRVSSVAKKTRKRKLSIDDSSKNPKILKKSTKKRWHVDNFAIKSKKKRLDVTLQT